MAKNGYRKRRGYKRTIDIGKRLTMSNETLDFIEKHDNELYKEIMES